MDNLHLRLREATKAPHRLLDRHPLLLPLASGEATEQTYGDALLALRGVYAPLEQAVCAAAVAAGFDYRQRRKLPAMDRDLAALGRSCLAAEACIAAPASSAALVGMLYTLEGSTLGAQAMQRTLAGGPCRQLSMQYFSGYGEATAARWQSFWQFAVATVATSDSAQQACDSAVATFNAIKQHLDQAHHELSVRPFMEAT